MKRGLHILVLTVLCLAGGCGKRGETAKTAVAVKIEPVQYREFQTAVCTQGVVEPVDQAKLSVSNAGVLKKLTVKLGDRVKKGQLLFVSDEENLKNRRELAHNAVRIAEERKNTRHADVEVARVSLEKAEKDYNRSRTLFQTKAVSLDKYENAELTFRKSTQVFLQAKASLATSQAEVDLAKSTLAITEKHLADARVCAPYDGIITAKWHEENEYCFPGTAVLAMERKSARRIAAVISAVHYPQIVPGKTQVAVRFAGQSYGSFPVTVVGGKIDEASRTFELKADLPANCPLRSGTLCDVAIVMDKRNSLAVPQDAVLFRAGGKFYVFILAGKTAKAVEVKPGLTAGAFTELLAPASLKGKPVIVQGQYFVDDGTPCSVL